MATIDKSGLLTACTPNKGGRVTVKATTLDGTNLSATRDITIEEIIVEDKPEPNEPDKKVYYLVDFLDWDYTLLKEDSVEQGKSAIPPADPIRKGYTFIGWDTDFSNVQSDLIIIAQYEEITNVENAVEERVAIYVIDGVLHIEDVDKDYRVLDAAGRLIYSGRESVLSLPCGVYVVVVGDVVEKVVL